MRKKGLLHPNTRRRIGRFRKLRRAWWSLWILLAILLIALGSNIIANNRPLLLRCNGNTYFPFVKFYSEGTFTGEEVSTRANYKALEQSELFASNDANYMIFPFIKFGPNETVPASEIEVGDTVTLRISRAPRVGTVDITAKGVIGRSKGAAGFFDETSERAIRKKNLFEIFKPSADFLAAVQKRIQNLADQSVTHTNEADGVELSLSVFEPRSSAPRSVRITIREAGKSGADRLFEITPAAEPEGTPAIEPADAASKTLWENISKNEALKTDLLAKAQERDSAAVANAIIELPEGQFLAKFEKETVHYPYKPVRGHPFGLDSSGRDVLVQCLYATRVSLLFGLILVVVTTVVGTFVGAVQGYFAGKTDLFGQRLTEIWEALPFLYIIMLLGSTYGRSFSLLLMVYAAFNWIGISYYMRGEFLKLRKQPFVEAARVMGLARWKVMFRHVLPNALVPVITLFPFSLVAAIFSLTALDFLGFGLPPETPSWGGLIAQGQGEFRYAWWLIVFPSIALFVVMLLAVFIGEGIRNAFDPRSESKLDG